MNTHVKGTINVVLVPPSPPHPSLIKELHAQFTTYPLIRYFSINEKDIDKRFYFIYTISLHLLYKSASHFYREPRERIGYLDPVAAIRGGYWGYLPPLESWG